MRIAVCFALSALFVGCSESDPKEVAESTTGQQSAPADESAGSTGNTEEPTVSEDSPKTQESQETEESAAPPAADTTSIVDQIQGRWVITEASVSGQAMDAMKGTVAEISGNEITITAGGQETKSTLKFNDGTNPIQFDAMNAAGQTAKAILELNGDELSVNTSLTGEAYPASFEPGAGLMLVKYKRE